MSQRELDCYAEGRQDLMDQCLEVLSWMTANLINVHVTRSGRVQPATLVPDAVKERARERAEFYAVEQQRVRSGRPATAEEARARVRDFQDEREDADFWRSEQGQRITALALDDELAHDIKPDEPEQAGEEP